MRINHIVNNLSDNSFTHDILVEDCNTTLNGIVYRFNSQYYNYKLEQTSEQELYFYARDEKEANHILDDLKKYYQGLINHI